MIRQPFLIGIIATAAFVGTTVVSAQTDWTANLSDPGNPMWQQMPMNGSSASGLQYGANAANFPDMPVTFRQVIWMISQYDRYVVQPMRMQLASLQQQVNSIQTTSYSSSGYGSCGIHQVGDTYAAPDNCNVCTCTSNGQICTERACQMSSSSSPICNYTMCIRPPAGCYADRSNPSYGCCGRIVCPANGSSSSAYSYGNSCGGHQVGDRYWNGCNLCTCTSSGQICTMNACRIFGSSSSSQQYCNYSMCAQPPAGCYQDRTNPAYGCCGRVVCPGGGGGSSFPSGGSCGNHQVGDQYWVGNCSICTCTANGQVCSTSSDPGCHQPSSCESIDCAAPPVGCHYANPVISNGCVQSCGQLVCNWQSSLPSGGGSCANGHGVGDQYWIDSCHTCTCTANGQVCSNHC
ncbi:MAG TPA: hypothetical protein VHA78_04440 [Candidatus Peribacteraceae bacterium]|nr:hypothetical protein [Candidatus Peribacteraceae bacterium]